MKRQSFVQSIAGAAIVPSSPGLPASMLHPGDVVAAYGSPSSFEHDVARRPSGVRSPAMTPLDRQLGTITPSGLCFVRTHAGVPRIDPRGHELLVHGSVKKPLVFTLADLMRFPSVTRTYFLECSGNSAPGWQQLGSSVQFSHGLASCCEWTGVPLSLLLDEAGASESAAWVLAEGADGAAYDRSVPMRKVRDDALVVYGQNGEMLRPEQGYPMRLFLPGYEGSANVKWLRRIKVMHEPIFARDETARYGIAKADGRTHVFSFVMNAKSVVTYPAAGTRIAERGTYELRGFAWSGAGTVVRIDVTLDGGHSWSQANFAGESRSKCFVRFTLPFRFDGSELLVASRATDDTGYVQPSPSELAATRGPNIDYHYNAIQTWRVGADGEVSAAS